MLQSFFVSDLHGAIDRYQKLFQKIEDEKPDILFLGGDLLPSGLFLLTKNDQQVVDFLHDFLIPGFNTLKQKLGKRYPATFCILGNDDGRSEENIILQAEKRESGSTYTIKKYNSKILQFMATLMFRQHLSF